MAAGSGWRGGARGNAANRRKSRYKLKKYTERKKYRQKKKYTPWSVGFNSDDWLDF